MTVAMLPGAHRPEGALAWLNELLANDAARGVIVAAIDQDGSVDCRIFGVARRMELAFTGAVLSEHSVNGDLEPAP